MMKILKHIGSFLIAFLVIFAHIHVDIMESSQGDFFDLFIDLAKDKKIFQYIFSLLMLYPIVLVVFSSIHNIFKNCFSEQVSEEARTRNKGLVGVILGVFVLYLAISIMVDTFNYEFKPLTIDNLGLKEAGLIEFLFTTFGFFVGIFILVLFIDERFMGITVSMAVLCLIFVYFTTSIRSYMIGALIGSWIAISLSSFLAQSTKEKMRSSLRRKPKPNYQTD